MRILALAGLNYPPKFLEKPLILPIKDKEYYDSTSLGGRKVYQIISF